MKKKILLTSIALCLAGALFAGQNTSQAKKKKAAPKKLPFTYVPYGKQVRIIRYTGKAKKVTIPKKIKGKTVTEIGPRAFNGSGITSVKIPNTVKKIRYYAFEDARQLKDVTLSNNVKTLTGSCFGGCVKLEKITLPKKLTYLGNAFEDCTKLKQITLPKGVTKIGWRAFSGCASLTSVKINSPLQNVEGQAFENCENLISVGNITVDRVEEAAFRGCSKLTSKITLSDKCTYVGNFAFSDCEQADIVIPESVKHIGIRAFANCKKLTSITIPDKFDGIGVGEYGGFQPEYTGFENEYETFLRNRVGKNFDMNAFAGCTNVSKLTVKDTSGALVEENGILYNRAKTAVLYVLPTYQGSLDFLKNVDSIANYAMSGFNQAEIRIPDNITYICEGAFYGAKSTQIHLGKGVKKILDQTFTKSGITSLVIPEGVEEIYEEAISYCKDCKSVSFPKSLKVLNYDGDFSSPLRGMSGLEKVEVAAGNPSYYAKDGMLFGPYYPGSAPLLLCYPAARPGSEYTLPMDVRLGGYAFDSLKYLKKIIIPEGAAQTSGYNLLVDCKDVTVQLPKTLTNFPTEGHSGDFPLFTNCTNCKALVRKNSKAHKYCKKQCDQAKRLHNAKDASMYAYKVIK